MDRVHSERALPLSPGHSKLKNRREIDHGGSVRLLRITVRSRSSCAEHILDYRPQSPFREYGALGPTDGICTPYTTAVKVPV